jgi:hypothetical protein
MAGLIVSWLSRAGKDELTRINPFVNCAAHVVPDLWLKLPLVDKPRNVALENQPRIQLGSIASSFVNVEKHLAISNLTSGFGLARGLCPLNKDRASGFQPCFKLRICDSRDVRH